MQHSIKYQIPAIVVKTRDEVLADKRQQLIDQVLSNPRLNSNQKMRLFESALHRRLVDEHKLDELLPYRFDDFPYDDDDTIDVPVETVVPMEVDPVEVEAPRQSLAYTAVTPKSQKRLRSGFRPIHAQSEQPPSPPSSVATDDTQESELPGYMKPLKRNTISPTRTTPILERLRPDRPPVGHFTGKGRLRVVRW